MNPFARRLSIATALAGLSAIAGCAYPQPPTVMTPLTDSMTYGYTDKQVGPKAFDVSFLGPQVMTRDIVPGWVEHAADVAKATNRDFALWRAAQVALQNGADTFVVTESKPKLRYYIVGHDYRDATSTVFYNITPQKPGWETTTYFRADTKLKISLDPDAKGTKYDAKQVAQEMSAKYPHGSLAQDPNQHYFYFGPTAFIQDYKGPEPPPYGVGSPYQAPAQPPAAVGTGPTGYKPYHGAQ